MTTSAPGTYVSFASAGPGDQPPASTGTLFVTGEAEMGPVGTPIPLTSMSDYASFCGSRNSYTVLYDALDVFFREGGKLAYLSRIVGPAAVAASVILKDTATSPANTLTLTAIGAGVWGNSVSVTVATGSVANTYTLTVTNAITGATFVSPNLTDPADAVTWAQNMATLSPFGFPVTIANDNSVTSPPGNNPATGTFPLTSGADDSTNVAEAQWTAGLTAFSPDLGPGQIAAPGHNTTAGWQALIAHASAADSNGFLINNRFALLDCVDSSSASTVEAQVAEVQGGTGDPSFGVLCAPWIVAPGISNGSTTGVMPTTRTVSPSTFVAAKMAQQDAITNPGQPAAGPFGLANYVVGVTQTYDRTDRGALDAAQVLLIRNVNGYVQPFGYKTCATNPFWVSASYARMRMLIVYNAQTIGAGYDFIQMDALKVPTSFLGDLSGMLQSLWTEGALYGTTATEAFTVTVNTSPSVVAQGILQASLAVKLSEFANQVQIGVTAYALTQNLP